MENRELELGELINTLISLNQNKDRIWAEKEFLREKITLMKLLASRSFAAVAEPRPSSNQTEVSPRDSEDEGHVREIIGRAKAGFNELFESLSVISRGIDGIAGNLFTDSREKKNLENLLEEERSRSQKLNYENVEIKNQINDLKRELNENAKERLEKAEYKNEKLAQELIATRQQLSELLDSEDQYIVRLAALERETEELRRTRDESTQQQTALNNLKHIISQGARDVEKIQEKNHQLTEERDAFRTAKLNLELENLNLSNKLQGLSRSLARRDKDHLRTEWEFTNKINDLTVRNENLADEVETLHSTLALRDEEFEKLKIAMDEMILERDTLNLRISDYEQRLEMQASSMVDVEVLSTEKAALEKRLAELETEKTDLEIQSAAIFDEKQTLEHSNSELSGDLETAREIISDLETRVLELEETLTLLEENAQELEDRLSVVDLDDVKLELMEMEQLITDSKVVETTSPAGIFIDENIQTGVSSSELQEENELLKMEVEHLTDEFAKLEKEYKALTDKLIEESENSDSMKRDLSDSISLLEKLKLEIAYLQDENEELRKENDKSLSSGDLDELRSRVDDLSGELRLAKEASESYYHALADEKARSATLVSELASRKPSVDVEKAIAQIINIETILDEFEDSLHLEETRLAKYCAELSEVEESVSDEIKHLNAVNEKLHNQIANMAMLSNSGSNEDLDILRRQAEATDHQNRVLNSKLGELEADLIIYQAQQGMMEEAASIIHNVRSNLEVMGFFQASDDLQAVARIITGKK